MYKKFFRCVGVVFSATSIVICVCYLTGVLPLAGRSPIVSNNVKNNSIVSLITDGLYLASNDTDMLLAESPVYWQITYQIPNRMRLAGKWPAGWPDRWSYQQTDTYTVILYIEQPIVSFMRACGRGLCMTEEAELAAIWYIDS